MTSDYTKQFKFKREPGTAGSDLYLKFVPASDALAVEVRIGSMSKIVLIDLTDSSLEMPNFSSQLISLFPTTVKHKFSVGGSPVGITAAVADLVGAAVTRAGSVQALKEAISWEAAAMNAIGAETLKDRLDYLRWAEDAALSAWDRWAEVNDELKQMVMLKSKVLEARKTLPDLENSLKDEQVRISELGQKIDSLPKLMSGTRNTLEEKLEEDIVKYREHKKIHDDFVSVVNQPLPNISILQLERRVNSLWDQYIEGKARVTKAQAEVENPEIAEIECAESEVAFVLSQTVQITHANQSAFAHAISENSPMVQSGVSNLRKMTSLDEGA
jgi:hypothetical protein